MAHTFKVYYENNAAILIVKLTVVCAIPCEVCWVRYSNYSGYLSILQEFGFIKRVDKG